MRPLTCILPPPPRGRRRFPMYLHLVLAGTVAQVVARLSDPSPAIAAEATMALARLLDCASLVAFVVLQARRLLIAAVL